MSRISWRYIDSEVALLVLLALRTALLKELDIGKSMISDIRKLTAFATKMYSVEGSLNKH